MIAGVFIVLYSSVQSWALLRRLRASLTQGVLIRVTPAPQFAYLRGSASVNLLIARDFAPRPERQITLGLQHI
jgi:hypothetical protein